jgi:hypothetical protein
MDTSEAEQWRRAFWVLVVLDRLMSESFGRPCAIQEEDFDVDLPMEIDDEYWENEHEPDQAFKQPAGKPSALSYFVSLIKLIQILAIALRTIVSRAPSMLLCLILKGCRSTRLTSQKSSLVL